MRTLKMAAPLFIFPKQTRQTRRCHRSINTFSRLQFHIMAAANQSLRPLVICSRCIRHQNVYSLALRTFSTSSVARAELEKSPTRAPLISIEQLDPQTVASVSEEHRLMKHRKTLPIGSRRRRAVLSTLKNEVPFEQLPYQCFQDARQILANDREEKLKGIEKMRARIARLRSEEVKLSGGEVQKATRLRSMLRELEDLKILADINDPMVKKRFEDGYGMSSLMDLRGTIADFFPRRPKQAHLQIHGGQKVARDEAQGPSTASNANARCSGSPPRHRSGPRYRSPLARPHHCPR